MLNKSLFVLGIFIALIIMLVSTTALNEQEQDVTPIYTEDVNETTIQLDLEFESVNDSQQDDFLPPTKGANGAMIRLNTEYPKVQESYPTYNVVIPDVTMDYMKEIAQKFGLNGTPILDSESRGRIRLVDNTKDPIERVSVYQPSGSIVYEIPDKKYGHGVKSQPTLPSDDEAKRIATEYLLERDLLPEDAKVGLVRPSLQVTRRREGIPIESYNVTIAVTFYRSINGIPVEGDEFSVIIGDKGEVVGVTKTWRELVPTENITIKTPEEAYEDFIAGKTLLPPIEMPIDEIIIDEIAIRYLMENRITEQESLHPVYMFKGTAIWEDAKVPYEQFVSAV